MSSGAPFGPRLFWRAEIATDAASAAYVCYQGVSHFLRAKEVHVHLAFNSPILTEFQVRMRKATPGLEEEYKEHALRAGDRSYDNPPVRWLHVSLATIERTGHWEDKVLRVEEAARNAIASKGLESALQSVSVHSICALSAVTDTPVRIA